MGGHPKGRIVHVQRARLAMHDDRKGGKLSGEIDIDPEDGNPVPDLLLGTYGLEPGLSKDRLRPRWDYVILEPAN
jgi:hypothetical protein